MNPAEICRERGWVAGDEIKTTVGANRVIVHIADHWIATRRVGKTKAVVWNADDDISDWCMAPRQPRYTAMALPCEPYADDYQFLCDGNAFAGLNTGIALLPGMDRERTIATWKPIVLQIVDALNAGPEPVKATEGPYKARRTDEEHKYEVVSRENIYGVELTSYIQTRDEFGEDVTDEILVRHAREIASEFNRLANAPGAVAGA